MALFLRLYFSLSYTVLCTSACGYVPSVGALFKYVHALSRWWLSPRGRFVLIFRSSVFTIFPNDRLNIDIAQYSMNK